MNKIAAKQIKTSPMQLWIALDDGRRVEIRTKHKGDKPMIGDPVFDEEGKLIREGELTTAETGERIVIESGVISDIIDTTLEAEPVQKWSRKEVQSFQGKAFQMLSQQAKKMSKESLIPKADFKQLRQKLSLKPFTNRVSSLTADIEALQAKIKDEIQLINDSK